LKNPEAKSELDVYTGAGAGHLICRHTKTDARNARTKIAAAEASDRNERELLQNRVALVRNEDNTEEALTSAAQNEKSTNWESKNGPNPVSTRGRDRMRHPETTWIEQTGNQNLVATKAEPWVAAEREGAREEKRRLTCAVQKPKREEQIQGRNKSLRRIDQARSSKLT
jgi:hypothetical protein